MGIRLTGDIYFDRFWAAWLKWVPHRNSDKGEARKEFNKAAKEYTDGTPESLDKFTFDLVSAVESQAKGKARLKKAGEFTPDFPAPHRYIKKQKWMDEVVSVQEVERRKQLTFCSCGSEATHGRMCSICFQRKVIDPKTGWDVKLRESTRRALEKNPKKSGESWAEWGKRLLTEGKFGNTYKPISHNSQKN